MDILLPYVDMDDPEWLEVFMEAKGMHPRNERAYKAFLAPFRRRFSSHGLFKYWWMALGANYKSLGKVHLLLMQESQYPAFLCRNDPRIVVHYHEEFIPEECRPCFNSSTIELCAIKNIGLSGNFILANDDMYFNGVIDDTFFESKDGRPLAYIGTCTKPYGNENAYRCALTNDHALIRRHYGKTLPYYRLHHLFQVYNSEFCKSLLESEWGTIKNGLGRWRNSTDYSHFLLMMAQNTSGISVHSEYFPHEGYFEMSSFTEKDYPYADTCKVICLNDTDGMSTEPSRNYLSKMQKH